jgi:hypothetical protein
LHFLDLLAKSMPVPDGTDTEFSFIPPAHFGRIVDLLCSCNGLLLFGCTEGDYIVCNPATKQWKTVPTRVRVHPNIKVRKKKLESTFLFFDPVVPSRFLLIQFWHVHLGGGKGVHTYSSETGKWSNRSDEWMQFASGGQGGCWGVTRKIRMTTRTQVRVLNTFKYNVRAQRDCNSLCK